MNEKIREVLDTFVSYRGERLAPAPRVGPTGRRVEESLNRSNAEPMVTGARSRRVPPTEKPRL